MCILCIDNMISEVENDEDSTRYLWELTNELRTRIQQHSVVVFPYSNNKQSKHVIKKQSHEWKNKILEINLIKICILKSMEEFQYK